MVKETGVESVIIAAPGLSQSDLSELIYRAQSLVKDVGVIPNLVGVPMANVEAESFFDEKSWFFISGIIWGLSPIT